MVRCAGCSRSLSGSYVKAAGKAWHQACLRCSGCGQTIEGTFVEDKGKTWHQACALSHLADRCAGCNQPIQGPLFKALSKSWHPTCFACAGCGKPITAKKFNVHDNRPWHPDCYRRQVVPPCTVCGEPLTQKHIIDEWGHRYCHFHPKRLPACYSCGCLICESLTRGGQKFPDGRTLCAGCLQTAVVNQAEGQHLLLETRKTMEHMGFSFEGTETPFRLAAQAELDKLRKRKRKSRPSLGMARSQILTRGNKVVERNFEEILIVNGLPAEHFCSVAAHELGHAWLFLKGFPTLPERVEEGLATLSEAFWLERQDTEIARIRLKRIHKSDDPVYGGGFRAARSALKKMKLAKLLTYVHKHKRFPGDNLLGRLFS